MVKWWGKNLRSALSATRRLHVVNVGGATDTGPRGAYYVGSLDSDERKLARLRLAARHAKAKGGAWLDRRYGSRRSLASFSEEGGLQPPPD